MFGGKFEKSYVGKRKAWESIKRRQNQLQEEV